MEIKTYSGKYKLTLLLDPRIAGFDSKQNPPKWTLQNQRERR